jgi:hypothetical protein
MSENKFKRIIEAQGAPAIKSPATRRNLERVLENSIRETRSPLVESTNTGDVAQYTPVLISLIRRVVPTLVGNELVGVQALQQPTGRIFCQRVFYGENRTGGTETWANGPYGSQANGAAPDPNWSGDSSGHGLPTDVAEAQGKYTRDKIEDGQNIDQTNVLFNKNPWPEMSFGIDYIDVTTKTRALKGKITTEIIQDLKAVHGLDAENELASILQTELVAEIDREIVAALFSEAKTGAQNCTTVGTFSFTDDADGRWSMEKVQGLMLQLEIEATAIAQQTRRGRGNFIVTSPELAAYLSMANLITNIYGNTGFTEVVNPVGISYYGQLCNRFKVYVDPYLATGHGTGPDVGKSYHQILVGGKFSEIDAALYYCPYLFSLFLKAQDPETFGTILGIKSRYGICSSPYMHDPAVLSASGYGANGTLNPGANSYLRKFRVEI